MTKWALNIAARVRLTEGVSVLVFLLAFLPRLTAVNRYITPDELIWVYRSVLFRQALLSGNWLSTLIAGHPGVTTTWLGAGAISLQLLVHPEQQAVYRWLTQLAWLAPDNMEGFRQLAVFLSTGRVAVAFVNSLGVTAVFLLARKLFPHVVAFAAALLIALDPFLIGLSGLLHVDALLTTFVTISLLALAVGLWGNMPWRVRGKYTAFSGAMAALSLLTKSPALLLLPFVAVALILRWWRMRRIEPNMGRQIWFFSGGSWLLAFGVVLFALFPALWSSPAQVLDLMSSNANRHIAAALRPTFFWGNVNYDHGLLFYPVALAYRLSPVIFLGIILSFWLIVHGLKNQYLRRLVAERERRWWTAGLLLLWSLLFVGGISVATKKFDRYALPIFPAVTLLATMGWYQITSRQWRGWHPALSLAVLLQAAYLLFFLPFPLSAYNLLPGGPWGAQAVMPLGWGEGIGAAARWLDQQPGIEDKTAVSTIAPSLAPFYSGDTLLFAEETWQQADYLILTAGDKQGNEAQFQRLTTGGTLLHTVRYGGLAQAWVYERPFPAPPPELTALPQPVVFDNRVQLWATAIEAHGERIDFYAQWGLPAGGENGRYTVKITLLDANNQEWTTQETPLLNDVYFYPVHWQPGETPQVHYAVNLPLAMPSASYRLVVELFDAVTGAQLPVLTENGRFAGVQVQVGEIEIVPPETIPNPARLAITHPTDIVWSDAGLRLLGYEPLPAMLVDGAALPIELYWQAMQPGAADGQLTIQLGEHMWVMPLSRWPVTEWRAGEVVHEKYLLPIPAGMAAGDYTVALFLSDEQGERVGGETAVLGTVNINPLDRLYALPAGIETPLTFRFREDIQLQGVDVMTPQPAPGEQVKLTLYWQVLQKPPVLYNAFVHLIGPDGEIVAQIDRWPGGLPADLWAAGQVIVDEYVIDLPPDAPPGDYAVAVGLYSAVDGHRLPITDQRGADVPDGRLLLPVTIQVGKS